MSENPLLDLYRQAIAADPIVAAAALRHLTVFEYAWAIPTGEALDTIAKYGPIVEICAGGGYWAKLLRDRGVDVVAYDIAPGKNHWVEKLWTDVQKGDDSDAGAHPDRTLFLCWPPYDGAAGTRAVKAHRAAGGDTFIHVGEHWGCTGDEELSRMIDPYDDETSDYEMIEEISIPQWPGMRDRLTVHRLR